MWLCKKVSHVCLRCHLDQKPSYLLTSSKFSLSSSVYNIVQKCVWEMPTGKPFLMCDFRGHIGWQLQAYTLLWMALAYWYPKIMPVED